METLGYHQRRAEIEEYFDRTAAETWARLTSDAPVGSIRATVRAGRDRMRATLLGFLPDDLRGQRVLDAGCGTGALAVEAARRGADVVAIDLSPSLVELARSRTPTEQLSGSIEFRVSDMLELGVDSFDWVVAMDSLIHYRTPDMVEMVAKLARSTRKGLAFTFAPGTTMLRLMHVVGKAFPRGNRSPAIVPVAMRELERALGAHPALAAFHQARDQRIDSGFYISHALELVRG